MATQRISWSSSGSPYVTFYLDADVVATEGPGAGAGYGRWLVRVYLRMSKGSSSNYGGAGTQYALVNGAVLNYYSADPFLPSGITSWTKGNYDYWVNANSAGYWSGSSTTLPLQMQLDYGNVHTGQLQGSIQLPRIAQVPSKPSTPTLQSAATTSISFGISAPNNNGSAITTYNFQASKDPSFATGVLSWSSGATNQVASPLDPGNDYYIRYRAVNGVGSGPYSDALRATTLPATPPGISIVPTISGTGSTVTLTPPSGASGVSKYTVERRTAGTTTPVTSTDTASSPLEVTGLTPGARYEYRASAWFGTYQSPWSDWVLSQQPNPSTSPGDYFDGSTPSRTDLTFGWNGGVNNSISEARGVGVAGWAVATSAGGSPRLQRISGGFAGSYAARALVISDMTGAGLYLGMDFTSATASAVVEESTHYVGSMYVRPSRAQLLLLELVWKNAAGTEISRTQGTPELVSDTTGWTRLIVEGDAPVGTKTVVVRVHDTAGTGFVAWKSGEWLDADAAMVTLQRLFTYFDGSTTDVSGYDYQWVGLPDESVSARFEVPTSVVDPLLDPDCPPPPAPPAPPAIVDDCIDVVGTWRRYWTTIPAEEISDQLTMLPTIRVTTGGFAANQVRLRVYRNPDNLSPTVFDAANWDSEQIISYMPALTTIVLDGVDQRVFAEVNGAAPIPADKLLYGTGGTPATWPTMSCGVGYLLSFDVPLDAPVGNVDIGVELTRRV